MSYLHHPPRIYQEALGIHTGDIVRTSYGSGPYEVWSMTPPSYVHGLEHGPEVVIHLWPTISLVLVKPHGKSNHHQVVAPCYYINNVRQVLQPYGSSRWFTDQNDEVLVEPSDAPPALPIDMFASYPPIPEPPVFQAGVEYSVSAGVDGEICLWHCRTCALDFNGPPVAPRAHVAHCPQCGHWGSWPVYVMQREAGVSECILTLNTGKTYDWQIRHQRPDGRAVGEIDPPPTVAEEHPLNHAK